ncbi:MULTISPECIES: ABC transporter substrate-binding protein [unclassified Variovorax]|mgnify:CR=1 FL=1|jgi:peptide/nickel transport system substrate-binding protein|uniref:ABC transporter substrate-binding protein n=1 Tax=unclassified Variovorax TaxID=663243 RepID=UPI0008693ACD|nr:MULTISPECIES: ABC transporter substrate-binding protein [unclassified Variovorax]MBN8755598.1 ABC transporter substrate-binding protein [Variovorax sp.]ODU19159.1 MAG: peptide ABC transporter substrate-binding protein [Variovorax sp. SCN 67-85]ODV23407.1 MAG: peptide ABC transporter substrate-binding protein [Variovorax sp. SCN 67-20]OJZ16042.1 MAG: peptide ABC transporter substrate-binding protein [Variovorax sp. 67-131]
MKHLHGATLIAVLLTGATATAAFAATRIVVALPADIRSSMPGTNRDDNTDSVILNVVEGLVGYGEGGDVKPLLARSVETSADGLTYTFRLRSDVRFHNGDKLSSADVLWSWNRYMDPKTEWRCLAEFDGRNDLKVLKVEAPDASTVVMRINRRSALFLDTLARTDCGMTGILSKASVKADGTWDRPIGTGPFEFSDWKRGRGITLSRFAGYKSPEGSKPDGYVGLKTPGVDVVQLQVIPDPATVKLGMASKSVDIAQLLSSDVVEVKNDPALVTSAESDSSKHALLFQTRDPLMADAKFRRAVAAALDYKQLVDVASDGLSKPNNSAVFERSVYADATQRKGFKTDLTQAKALLKESSYRGQTIKLIANKRSPMPSFQVALVTQAMLQAIGIKVEIEVLEWATQLDRYNAGNYQMMSFSYSGRLDPALSYEQFTGDKARQARKVWDNPEAIALIETARTVSDKAERQKIFDRLHEMALADVPLINLYNGLTVWSRGKRVGGFSPWEGKLRLWTARVGA